MQLSRTLAASALIVSASMSATGDGPRRDGLWNVTIDMQMPGMQMPPMKTTQCITKEEAADPLKSLPKANAGSECTVSDYKTEGNKISWSMKCAGSRPMSGHGELVYTNDSYTGTMTIDTAGQAMTMKYAGKRAGDCTK
jgi:hypothetical protein